MPLIPMEEVRRLLTITLPRRTPYNQYRAQKMENIQAFNALSRTDLCFGDTEKRILLYTTRENEKVFVQYPGKESVRETRRYPGDFRPVLQKQDGSFISDMDFKKIWDVIDRVGDNHRGDLDILSVLFLRIAYMWEYQRMAVTCDIDTVDIHTDAVISTVGAPFIWNCLHLDANLIETVNDRFGSFGEISLEGFLYYNDLLAQNEDCKYSYLKGTDWNVETGRINNCLSHLTVIAHLRGEIGISKLIDSFQRTGVAPLPQSRLMEACGRLVQFE